MKMPMWLHRFTHYLLRNRLQALALTFAIAFVPIIGAVGILMAALVTLIKGAVEGALFMAAATLPYVISFYFSNHYDANLFLLVWAALGVAVFSNVLTWVFAVMLYRKTSWSVILQIAALMGALAISVIHLAYPDVTNWWADQLQQVQRMAEALQQSTSALPKKLPLAPQGGVEAVNLAKQYATGAFTSVILFNALLQLIVARWWQAAVFAPGRLRLELHHIRLSRWAGVFFAASLVLSYLDNSVVLDIMPVLYLLFAAAGLSTIHYLFRLGHSSLTWFWMLLFYMTLIISMPVGIMLVAVLALLDTGFDVRKRFKKA